MKKLITAITTAVFVFAPFSASALTQAGEEDLSYRDSEIAINVMESRQEQEEDELDPYNDIDSSYETDYSDYEYDSYDYDYGDYEVDYDSTYDSYDSYDYDTDYESTYDYDSTYDSTYDSYDYETEYDSTYDSYDYDTEHDSTYDSYSYDEYETDYSSDIDTSYDGIDTYEDTGDDYYTNTDGIEVQSPDYSNDGSATARCEDGTYSYSQNRRGTCSSHGGVDTWE